MTYHYVQEQHVMYNGLNGLQDPEETGLNQASQKIHIWNKSIEVWCEIKT